MSPRCVPLLLLLAGGVTFTVSAQEFEGCDPMTSPNLLLHPVALDSPTPYPEWRTNSARWWHDSAREERAWKFNSWFYVGARAFDLATTWDAMGRGRREAGLGGLFERDRFWAVAFSALNSVGLWALLSWMRGDSGGDYGWFPHAFLTATSAASIGAGVHNLTAER
jgi:hypothetical protein